jgi:nicotinate-nucleotide adenylyltransferase
MRVGILGGTFDPPHIGHLVIAEEAREKLSLAMVFFVPAREPPHKKGEPISPLKDRVAMVRLALDDHPFFALSLAEAGRPGPSFTVDTLRQLLDEFPPATELYFVMGMDSLAALPTWHEPGKLIQLCTLAVLRRPGYSANMEELERDIPGLASRVVFIPAPELEISSTDLQARVRSGLSIQYMVPGCVAEYVAEHHLYE